jgi:ribonucleotide reductase alpha subunit
MATILGTVQSACTKFTYLGHEWKKNCEDERLLGVSFTGLYDTELTSSINSPFKRGELSDMLQMLRQEARDTNKEWADIMDINPSKSITCCKPSGTTSCVAGTSSGIHPRFSEYYIRRVRIDNKRGHYYGIFVPNESSRRCNYI